MIKGVSMNDSDLYGYKIGVLRNMLECEKDERTGGYGAHITHWSSNRSINIGADAIEALIKFYEGKAKA